MEKEKIKSIVKYICIFSYSFLCLLFIYTLSRGDLYVNYGFSYAISRGEVPYVDFNLVILPFAPFLYAIFLLFSKSIICYYLGQALLLTIFSYFVFKLLDKKAFCYFAVLLMPFPIAMASVIFPGYNFLLLLLTVIVIYLEKEKKSDYLIGVLLGCLFLTKQTVGGLLCLASIYYLFKDWKKVLKRVLGFFIPVLVCFLYLVLSGSLASCVDLCFLGLFDFGHSNFYYDKFYLIYLVIAFFVVVYRIFKRPKDIDNYYLLLFMSCTFPLIDYYHVSLFLALFFLVIFSDLKINVNLEKQAIVFIIAIGFIWGIVETKCIGSLNIVNYKNLELSIFSSKYINNVEQLDNYLDNKNMEVVYFLRGSENYFYKIKSNSLITYFDLPNYGNYGYNGMEKIINKLSELDDVLIVIDKSCYLDDNEAQQYIKEAVTYIIENCKFVKKIGNYEVYLKE